MTKEAIRETTSSWISEDSQLEGQFIFSGVTRIFGNVKGTIQGRPGSHIVIMESSRVDGEIKGDRITVNGLVEGKVTATTRVAVASYGRVIGEIEAPEFDVAFGAIIDGEVKVNRSREAPLSPQV
ncbi:MAG: polymer-forming cytoskeletal protein [Proteobacteria bacterium]|nr:MAG: polymer-forming cytoskeletal protein [Pseudomonadota bacterium]